LGAALTVIFAIALGAGLGLLGGIIPLAIGVGLLAYYVIKRGDVRS
jgi:hypothetical protein